MFNSPRSIVAHHRLRGWENSVRSSFNPMRKILSFCSAMSLYPHRILSIIGRTSSMPVQTLCTSCDTNYLIGTSTSQETLQLIDAQQLKITLNQKKTKGGKRANNSFFEDLEGEEQHVETDEEEDDSSDSDEETKKPRKKKRKSS